jgi:P-type DNA transfer ATPase VirB11
MNLNVSLMQFTDILFGDYLKDDTVTEIVINRPNEIWIESKGQWNMYPCESVTDDNCMRFANALARASNDTISSSKPILSSTTLNKERVQIVIPPAAKAISITIRKPSSTRITFDDYKNIGYFDRIIKDSEALSKEDLELITLKQSEQYAEFIQKAVVYGKNIVIAGETGSGKTTFMKSLIDFIPLYERLITIEDVEELNFVMHQNYVNLFYPSEAKSDSPVTSSVLLKSCLRMKPDRILLAELRGGETYDFINVVSSGHNGSLSSCHAGSVKETFERLILMTLQSKEGSTLDYATIRNLLVQTIDIVIHVTNTPKHGRHITEIYFGAEKRLGSSTEQRH